MHPIAKELNNLLRGTVVDQLLSNVGRRMFFPRGIVAQTAEAMAAGVQHNATQGIATVAGEPQVLPSVSRHYTALSSAQIAAYAPTGGILELRMAWQQEIYAKNPTLSTTTVPFSMPIVTAGITHAISVVADLFADPDVAVLTAHPYWGNYRLIFTERHDADLVTYPLFTSSEETGNGYNITAFIKTLAACRSKKILCLFNFPHNPTGYTPRTEEVDEIVDALISCADHNTRIAVLCDDAYFGLQHETGLMHESLFARLANSHRNILAIKADGATKEEFAWGFRVGFITFGSKELQAHHYQALEKKVLGTIRATLSNCNTAAQHIIRAALQTKTHTAEKKHFIEIIRARYQEVQRVLATHAGNHIITPLPFNSGYFVTLRCTGIDAEQLRISLLECGIGIIAIDTEHIRVTYSTLEQKDIAFVFATVFECANALA